MNQPVMLVVSLTLLIAAYNGARALLIVFRSIRELAYNRDYIRLSERNPLAAFAILLQTPGRKPGFVRYSFTGFLFFLISIWMLSRALPTAPLGARNDDWLVFGRSLIRASSAGNVDVLVRELSFMDIQSLERLTGKTGSPVPTREGVVRATQDAVKVFLRSYDDLFDGTVACVAAPEFDVAGIEYLKSLDPRAVLIWVRKGDRYRGIKIHMVIHTSEGLKVMDWLGDHGHPTLRGAALWKKRADVEASELSRCEYPSSINYQYEYRKQ